MSADEKSPELAKKNESPANKTTLAEPVVKEDPSQFPAGTVPTIEVPVSNGASAEELKKLEELHNKKGGGQKEEKKEVAVDLECDDEFEEFGNEGESRAPEPNPGSRERPDISPQSYPSEISRSDRPSSP